MVRHEKPSIDHLRQFGCVAFHRIPTKIITEGAKLDPRSVKCCLLGYIGNHMYRLWDPTRQKLIVPRDVVFKEDEVLPLSDFGTISNSEEHLSKRLSMMKSSTTNQLISKTSPPPIISKISLLQSTQRHSNTFQPHRQPPKSRLPIFLPY